VFFASSGDNGAGVIWPSASPNVASVGGTTLNLDPTSGAVISETAWSGSGGGVSAFEPQPVYQTNYGLTNLKRSTPDVSYDADPNTGVYVYDSTPYQGSIGWWNVGGTSVGSPQWAAIQALGQSTGNTNFYKDATQSASTYFRDITSGSDGNQAGVGYDLVTGLGSPITTNFAPQTTPDFTISASSPITINAGTSGPSTITATFLNGFNNPVTLSTPIMPSGWTTGFGINPLLASGSSILTVTVPAGTASGSYTVGITGSYGTTSHSVSLTVQVVSPDFSISASPTTLTINSGSFKTSTITVTPLNGYTGTVQLSAVATGGLTVTPSPTSITASGTSTLTVTVPSNTPTQTCSVTVTGSDGTNIHSTTLTVQVVNPDFSISTSPTSLSIRSGSSGTSTVTIKSLNGFSGAVALALSKAPTGLTATHSPTSITTSGTSTLRITVSSSIRSGTYTFTVTGTSGTLTHSATVTVTVSRF